MSTSKARADSLSLLLFTLRSGKLMAINLLKVSEIIPCPPLTKLPESHPHVKGIAMLRGTSLSVIDLSRALDNLRSALLGHRPQDLVNPQVWKG